MSQLFSQCTAAAMKEMARIIRPEGRFVLLTWNERPQADPSSPLSHHIDRALHDACFVVEASEEAGTGI